MRAFVAVDLPTAVVSGWSTGSVDQPSHLTLQFLGDVPDDRVGAVRDALATVATGSAPFAVSLEGIGAFPGASRPRVVFVGVARGGPALVELAGAVHGALAPLGFAPEARPFVPHATLVRVRSGEERRRARELLDHPPSGPLADGRIVELLLKESRLDRAGAVHRVVARFPLGGRPPA